MALPAAAQHDPDVPLIEALQDGNAELLPEFIRRHERWVRGVVYGVLGNTDQIDDVMQKVWMTVWKRSATLEDPRRWKHWLYRLARNAAIDSGRRVQRRRNLWQRLTRQQPAVQDGQSNPQRLAMIREEHQRVLEAVSVMPAIYREPFVLRHLEDWSYRQIADTLDLPVDTVGTRLVRARRMLQETLSRS